MNFSAKDEDIQCALDCFIGNQLAGGGWSSGYGKSRDEDLDQWVTLAVCRVLKHFLGKKESD